MEEGQEDAQASDGSGGSGEEEWVDPTAAAQQLLPADSPALRLVLEAVASQPAPPPELVAAVRLQSPACRAPGGAARSGRWRGRGRCRTFRCPSMRRRPVRRNTSCRGIAESTQRE